MTRIFQTIKCFFWKAKKRLSFKIVTLPPVIDAGDLYPVGYKIYVNNQGKLMFQSRMILGEVKGACEWGADSKRQLQIKVSKTIIDVLVKPLAYVE